MNALALFDAETLESQGKRVLFPWEDCPFLEVDPEVPNPEDWLEVEDPLEPTEQQALAYFDDPRLFEQVGCVYDFGRRKNETQNRWMQERAHSALEMDEDLCLECDAVVIGSGAGGAPCGMHLRSCSDCALLTSA